jgi:NAD(P)-dependent dehydrogenase (short-subunit alcohol dehydrogenase family)
MDYAKMFSLEGRTAVVTGGASGMGAAIVEGYASNGVRVVIIDVNDRLGEQTATRIGSDKVSFLKADVTDSQEVDGAVSRAHELLGRIDILVNAAGVFLTGPVEDLSDSEWDRVMKINVYGTFYMSRAVGRIMIAQQSGKIINFSSTDAFLGVPNQPVYCASKGAVNQLTRVLAVDWIKHGINVNAIGPCDFATPMIEPYLDTEEYRSWILDALPVGRVGQPPEIVGAAVFLASEASKMVVGHTLLVDGGRTVI